MGGGAMNWRDYTQGQLLGQDQWAAAMVRVFGGMLGSRQE